MAMRFSGHETFAIREGWLFKGLSTLNRNPDFFEQPFPADQLGVGGNMAKSIRHWLVATGLAAQGEHIGKSRAKKIIVSELGNTILEHDPYFNMLGTWCFVHTNLVNSEKATASWDWFFGSYAESVFTRTDVLEQFRRWAQHYAPRQPSPVTLQKDLNCLLASYAQRPPSATVDPEEATDCPLWELELVNFYGGSASFRTNRSTKKLPAEVIGYTLAISSASSPKTRGYREVPFEEASSMRGGPGRTFLMGPSALYDAVATAISESPKCGLDIRALAGQRVIAFKNQSPLKWALAYYKRNGK